MRWLVILSALFWIFRICSPLFSQVGRTLYQDCVQVLDAGGMTVGEAHRGGDPPA